MPFTSWNMVTISETALMIVVGSTKAQGSKAKPTESGQSRPEQAKQATKRHKGWPAVDAFGAPSRGPGILKLHI
jgi:hypothetical protein